MHAIIFLLIVIFQALAPSTLLALNYTMALPHYAADMEFFYQKPRAEIVLPMLKNLESQGVLAQADKRLMVAAFLAQLSDSGLINLEDLAAEISPGSRDARRVLAWSARLANAANGEKLIDRLLDEKDSLLKRQIKSSPVPLAKWDACAEKSILAMYWGAFMATGQTRWIDGIINCALGLARGKPGGPANDAAAALYEYARRHPLVAQRVRHAANAGNADERKLLEMTLGGLDD